MRTGFAIASIVCLSLGAQVAAQSSASATAMKLLGKFAVDVLANIIADIAADPLKPSQKREVPHETPLQKSEVSRQPSEPIPYSFTLSWRDPRNPVVSYTGILKMRGRTGAFRVVMSNGTREVAVVEQLMRAERFGLTQDILLIGSFPRIVRQTRQAQPVSYVADSFRLTQTQPNFWTIADTCDNGIFGGGPYVCATVNVIAAETGWQAR